MKKSLLALAILFTIQSVAFGQNQMTDSQRTLQARREMLRTPEGIQTALNHFLSLSDSQRKYEIYKAKSAQIQLRNELQELSAQLETAKAEKLPSILVPVGLGISLLSLGGILEISTREFSLRGKLESLKGEELQRALRMKGLLWKGHYAATAVAIASLIGVTHIAVVDFYSDDTRLKRIIARIDQDLTNETAVLNMIEQYIEKN